MEEKMDSDQSESGSSSSTSETSSGSSEGEEEVLETVRILGQSVEIPQELCEDYTVFKEFFSMKTWEALDDSHKEHLMKYLPKFPENDKEEKEKTIKMLFNHEPFHFTSPFGHFYNNLKQGNYRPDIAKMRKFLRKASVKQQRHKLKSYYAKLLPEVLISRERLLTVAKAAPPGPIPCLPLLPPKPSSKSKYKPVHVRARQRYFEELSAIRAEVGGDESDDENYPDGPPELTPKKRKQTGSTQCNDGNVSGTLGGSDSAQETSLECLKNILAAHRTRRIHRENHPELNTTGITLEDIKQRVALVNGAKKLMFGGQKADTPLQKLRRGPKKDKVKQDARPSKKAKEEVLLEGADNRPLLPNIKIKCEQEESDSESSSFVDPVASPKQSKNILESQDIKQEVDVKYPNATNINYNEPNLERVKQEPPDPMLAIQNASRILQPVPIKLEDLDGIDMMALPVEIADDSGEVIAVDPSDNTEDQLIDTDESLTETTHANFLSLVRALFPARAAHRASKQQLHARCGAVMRSPIAPLNTWYSLSDDWCAELDSALDFLAGERGPHPDDFVPYLQFMPDTQMYQWIGAGRDCDAILSRLCERWLRAAEPPPAPAEPPPARHPTSWVVRSPTAAEIAEFRAQERKRFASAAKPFTYVQYGYRSVVGPCVRSLWGGAGPATSSAALCPARPRAATLPALLRDAIARLPNGEGTRQDIIMLLRMSQWILPCSDRSLLSAVSSTLDRLHSAKRDPVVKYDQRTAIWTYLYRHRSEEDWNKVLGGRGRAKIAATTPALPTASPPTTPTATPTPAPTATTRLTIPQPMLELEVGTVEEIVENASDSDVDVDDTSPVSSVPHLSSAQLLMQAQASQGKPQPVANTPPTKPKGKLVAMPPQKTKTPAKQTPKPNLMTQSVKQANLLNQAKQALAQTAKSAQKQTTQAKVVQPKPQSPKQPTVTQSPKQQTVTVKPSLVAAKTNVQPKVTIPKPNLSQPKQTVTKPVQSPKTPTVTQVVKSAAQVVKAQVKAVAPTSQTQIVTQVAKSLPAVVATPHKSPLIKQRPLQKVETVQPQSTATSTSQQNVTPTVVPTITVAAPQAQNKVIQGTRSLLLRPPAVQTTVTAVSTPTTQVQELLNALQSAAATRGVVRVLSPAAQAQGKSLISPRALATQGTTVASKKRASIANTTSVSTIAQQQSTSNVTAVVSSVPTAVTSSVATRTVQLAGGRTVQLAANQTVHLPGGQAVQLTSGHTLQLSSLQLPTHSVRLPSGQTVQLASPQVVRPISTTNIKTPTAKTLQSSPKTQIPVSAVQLAGQTVQIGGQTVQLAGQSVQLTGHTVKLPSGQSVQVASQSVLPSQSVQLPSGQTVQLSSNVQTVLGSNVQLANQSVQIPSAQIGSQTVQIGGQTVQLAGGQTVQLPSGQTLQLSGQTVQLSGGQTIQLASGQTVQLANQTPKSVAQVVRTQPAGDKPAQPIVAKLLTNAQGQMISLEGMMGGSRPPALQQLQQLQLQSRATRGVRLLSGTRPLLLTAAKPLHDIILQQSDGSAIRVTSSGGATPSQTIVLSNIGGQAVTTPTTSTPVLKLQQVNPIQQVKLAQGIKIQQQGTSAAVAAPSGIRSVLMDGQQLKLVGGRHVLARILRPAHPPQ